MTPEQKRDFYRDGYLIFRDIVPKEKYLKAARTIYRDLNAVWNQSMALGRRLSFGQKDPPQEMQDMWLDSVKKGMRTGVDPAILDLFAPEDPLRQSIEEALGGPLTPPRGAQLATIFPSEPTNSITECGYPSQDIPYFGWHGHLDGLWNGSAGVHQRTDRPMNEQELANWSKENARNGVRKTYPSVNSNISGFTGLLGIPLSNQMEEGCGNVGLLRGAHHHLERFFQHQRDLGGPFGPDGPNWPRIDEKAPNFSGLRHYPDQVREAYRDTGFVNENGYVWPKPDLIKVKPGDAVLALHGVPHCSTRNESESPRFMAYFRLVAASRPKENPGLYTDALCDCWVEWHGMQETVSSMRAAEQIEQNVS